MWFVADVKRRKRRNINLRSLIADPATPEHEKQSLKRIPTLQRAWRVSR